MELLKSDDEDFDTNIAEQIYILRKSIELKKTLKVPIIPNVSFNPHRGCNNFYTNYYYYF